MSKKLNASPLSLYRALRSLNPSPHMYFYNFGDMHVIGASPEILVRNEQLSDGNKKVTIRPLAGTRPRGATPERDEELAVRLMDEHLGHVQSSLTLDRRVPSNDIALALN